MAIIYSYPDNTNILLTDLLIGTSTVRIAGKKKNLTKNFTIEALSIFLNNQNPIAWGNISGSLEKQTDLWNALESKQGNITLTTVGSSGASTLVGDTLNIPNYSGVLPINIVTGTFTSGTIPIANGVNSLTDSKIKFVGTWNSNTFTFASNVGIINSYTGLEVEALEESRLELTSGGGFSANLFNSYGGVGLRLDGSLSTNFIFYYDGYDPLNRYLLFQSNEEERLRLTHNGNIMMGNGVFNSLDNGIDKLQVNGSIKSTAIRFDLLPISVPTTESTMSWNEPDGTLNLILKGGNVTLQIGQETVMRVVNKTATNIDLLESNYQVVRLTGAQGQRPKVDLALAINDANSAETLGLVTETIPNNQEGFITTSGIVRNINTTGSLQGETWVDGDILYVSGTIAGQLTNIKPIAPIHLVIVGYVIYAHINNGKIFVKVDNGYELQELHNVSAISPINNDVLSYNSATSLWEPKLITNTELNIRRTGYTVYNEFLSSVSNGSYAQATISAGTIVSATGNVDANHVGVVGYRSSTAANSGFYSALNPSAAVHFSCTLIQDLQSDLIFKTFDTISPTTTIRFGVGTGSISAVEYTNGFYFEIIGNQLVGKTANVSVRSSTPAFTLSDGTWYHLRVKVISITLIRYYVYDMDGTLLFSATLNTTLPSTTIVMNNSVIVTNSGIVATTLAYLDLISITFPSMVRGALN